MNIVYFGNGSFRQHKRGVENVIEMQSQALPFSKIYYVHWGNQVSCYKYGKYICFSVKNGFSLFFVLLAIMKRIYRKGTSLLHSHNPLMSFFYAGKTDVFTVHDGLYYQSSSEGAGKLKRMFFYLVEKTIYKRSKKVHFISNFTKKMSLFGQGKNDVLIYNTSFLENKIKLHSFDVSIQDTIPNAKIKVLSVRSIEERARFDLLLEVAQQLSDTHHFTIAGKGPLLTHFINQIAILGISNISFLGFVTDETLIQLYHKTDIVLTLAEYGEGFGLPIIEGYVCNKPVYASDKCAIPEVIIHNDYLVQNTVADIVAKIKTPKTLETNAYQTYYNSRFANQKILQEVKNLYHSLTK